MLIDTHAHINDRRLLPLAEDIASSMQADNISHIINVGYDAESSEECVRLADKHQGMFAAVGIHPHDAKEATQKDYDRFGELCANPKVVAYGEIGLDYYYDLSDRDTQKRVFVEQLEVAYSLKKPVIIHLRDAYADMHRLIKENKDKLGYGFVLHCYSGSAEMAVEFARLGAYFSFGGAVTFKNANKEPIVRSIPDDRLMLETDCPYMTPVPYRGKDNLPKYINLVADKIQEWFPTKDIAALTSQNARRFFGLK
ncbi:MAG TPA: TatD family hydrolase [Clostridia bacterium]|nr:TatD family hydrolase [Clostridia bacterium]